ncbi:MAG: hypothetical protein ACI35U_04770 [Marinilabiliaceae bacterium]|nr:hypothetical protein [Bacteroidales bacterium]MDD5815147.1 hypothetical protein [Bacteroidales bacterium]
MKKLVVLVTMMICALMQANAQCGDELMKTALGAMGSYQYIKDFEVNLPAGASKEGTKFSVVLNSRTHYQINVANGSTNAEDVIIQIYDGDKLIGANQANGKTFPAFQFICSKTGAYKLHVFCAGGGQACARAVLSLVKQYTEAEMP